MYMGMYGIYFLVSSMHIEGGIGSTSLAISLGTSLIPPFILPFFLNKFGVKTLLISAAIFYALFAAGNVYSSHVTMILAGLFFGLGCNLGWPMTALTNIYFAKSRQSFFDCKKVSEISKRYFGMFFAIVSLSSGVGNCLMYLILATESSVISLVNSTSQFCGANDCQEDEVTQMNLGKYTPGKPETQYFVAGVCFLFELIAAIIFYNILPTKEKIDKVIIDHNDVVGDEIHKCSDSSNKNTSCQMLLSAALDVLKFLFTQRQIFVVLLPLYSGMSNAFVAGELSRAFASCILGLDKVSLCFVTFSVINLASSFIFAFVAERYGRSIPLHFAFLLDQVLYLLCLFLDPTKIKPWNIYFLFACFGWTQGTWLPLTPELYTDYFKNDCKVAIIVHQLVMVIGGLFVYSVSTLLCMTTKIYTQIAVLTFALLLLKLESIFKLCKSGKTQKLVPTAVKIFHVVVFHNNPG